MPVKFCGKVMWNLDFWLQSDLAGTPVPRKKSAKFMKEKNDP